MKALILIDNFFEDSEVFYPMYRLQEAGYTVITASKDQDQKQGKYGYLITPDEIYGDVDPDLYDILIIPGGKAPESIRLDENAIKIVKEFNKKKKTIGAICHGPQVLISAKIVKNKNMTCYVGMRDDLKAAGAKYKDKNVIQDKNIITSRKPEDLPFFMKKILEKQGVKK